MAKVKLGNVMGPKGDTGTRGSEWRVSDKMTGQSTSGTAFPGAGFEDSAVNDMCLNPVTFDLYRCQTAGNAAAAKWVWECNIKGAPGPKGDKGDPTTVDAALSATSTNPIQNKAVNAAITDVRDSLDHSPFAGAKYFIMKTTRAKLTFKTHDAHRCALVISSGNGYGWMALISINSAGLTVQKLGDVSVEKQSNDSFVITTNQWSQCIVVPIVGTIDVEHV